MTTPRMEEWKQLFYQKDTTGHDILSSKKQLEFNRKFISTSLTENYALALNHIQNLPQSCFCQECFQAFQKHIFELELELITKTNIHKSCTICGKQAKSLRAMTCGAIECLRTYRKNKKPIQPHQTKCVICFNLAKRRNAKLCNDKKCYNQHHANLAKKRQKTK